MTGVAKLMFVADVCDYLGVSRYFVYDQVRLGALPCSHMARQLRFRPGDIDKFIEERAISASSAALRAIGSVGSRSLQRRGA